MDLFGVKEPGAKRIYEALFIREERFSIIHYDPGR
jgi:hypothetical protein